ncbi:MAG TPA: transcription antitermination factor NusB [Lachnospiraceae bacterium]|nr:transcription antitermination factor NusB [Lachnospiraceae bacterium]
MKRQDVREHVFRLLFRVEFTGIDGMEEQLDLYFDAPSDDDDEIDSNFSEADNLYIRKKYEGIAGHLDDIDRALNEASKGWEISRMGKVELSVLRLAVYEILYDEDIPTGVAIDQAVELAKKYGQDGASAFINGILANIARLQGT